MKRRKRQNNVAELKDLLQKEKDVTVLFASPSAVEIFAEEVAPYTGWDGYTIGAIGHVTERALIEAGCYCSC